MSTELRAHLTRLLTGAGLVVEGDETLDELHEAAVHVVMSDARQYVDLASARR